MNPLPYTASALERVSQCPASAVLPRVVETNEDAERGTELHHFAARVVGGESVEASLVDVPEDYQETARHLDFRRALGDLRVRRPEVAYGYNLDTKAIRDIGSNNERRYPTPIGQELFGSIDVDAERVDGVAVVGDWKFGHGEVTATVDNPQITYFARIRSRLREVDVVEGRIWKVDERGRVFSDSHLFTSFDLDVVDDELEEAAIRVEGARAVLAKGDTPQVNPGPWCRYCPALGACPRYAALARSMVPELEHLEERVASLSLPEAGQAWIKAKAIEQLLERVLDGLKLLAQQSPLPLGGGMEVRANPSHRDTFDASSARALLERYGATEAEINALYRTTHFPVVMARKIRGAARARRRKAA